MSYSSLGGAFGNNRRVPIRRAPPKAIIPVPAFKKILPYQSPPIMPYEGTPIMPSPVKCACPLNGIDPSIHQLAKFLENYRGYVLAFSPSTNSIAAYPQGMKTVAFTIKLNQNEPTDAGLSRARAAIDAKGSLNGLGNIFNDMGRNAQMVAALKATTPSVRTGGFNPHQAWGNRYKPAAFMGWRSGNGRRQGIPFYAQGMNGVTPIVVDPPIDQQAFSFDAPSLTIYMGSNKIALIPALISALAVKVILLGGSKVGSATKFWGASDKAAKRLARA